LQSTPPNAKRYRELLRTLKTLPTRGGTARAAGVKAERQRAADARSIPVSSKDSNDVVEVVQLSSGKVRREIEIDTHENAFWITGMGAAGKCGLVSDSLGRQTVYSLGDRRMIRRIVGRVVGFVVAPEPIIVIEPGNERLQFCDPTR
jgi:hypothetical protein